jgi:hypothetical protein
MTTELNPVLKLGDLIEQLESEIDRYEISTSEALARAYAAGADQQLAEDAKWLDCNALNEAHLKTIPVGGLLKEAMRPKPPSLKEQALDRCNDYIDPDGIIRRALESLPN